MNLYYTIFELVKQFDGSYQMFEPKEEFLKNKKFKNHLEIEEFLYQNEQQLIGKTLTIKIVFKNL